MISANVGSSLDHFFILNIHTNCMLTNLSWRNAGMQAPCVFFENDFLTLWSSLKIIHFISFFILKPEFVLVTLCISILARLWIQHCLHPLYANFRLSSSEHSRHQGIQSRHNQGVKDGHIANLLCSCLIIWEMTVSAIWVCLFYCSPGVVCVIRKRVSFEDSLLQNITVTFDPAAFAGLTGFLIYFLTLIEIELIWNW